MQVSDFNALPAARVVDLLRACVDIDAWARALEAGRPYADVPALISAAHAQSATWTDAEVEAALADHPRIGERHGGSGASAAMSAQEQSGVDRDDTELLDRIAEGNRRYEDRFGRVFLIRARGRTAHDVLAELDRRLTHDPASELAVTTAELRDIALLRLEALLA
ncbi:2-oxo-4-hydroxy-4-carboxy-5-ureidoimidazoline decarboxylase [Nocardioides ultimimeridianus]